MSEIKLDCGVCQDLIPLVRDGVAGAESEAAVRAHAAGCPACGALLQTGPSAALPNDAAVLRRVRRRLSSAVFCLVVLGALAGVGLTGGAGAFYNAAIMPLLGAAMYCFLKTKGLLAAPLVALLALGWGGLRQVLALEEGAWFGFLIYGVVYGLLVALGWAAAFLAGCALHKGAGRTVWARAAAGTAALALAAGLVGGYIQLNGEIFTRLWLTARAKSYVSERWPGTDYQVKFASYSFKSGEYLCQVNSPSSPDTRFSVYAAQGELADNYDQYVASGMNTAERLRGQLSDWVEKSLAKKSGLTLEFAFADWAEGQTLPVELDQPLRLDRLPAPFTLTAWVVSGQADQQQKLIDALLAIHAVLKAEDISPAAYTVNMRWPDGPDGSPQRYDGAHIFELPAALLEQTPAAELPGALERWDTQWQARQEQK